jgi:hypothetical protein
MPSSTLPSPTPTRTALASRAIAARRLRASEHARNALARYVDRHGRVREVIEQPGFGGSVLVLDRDAATLADALLVAHLCADEPSDNAALVCASYLDQVRRGGGRCRSLTPADLHATPLSADAHPAARAPASAGPDELVDRFGGCYRLLALRVGLSIPELRWSRCSPPPLGERETVSVREAIGALERYEPVRAITDWALTAPREQQLSTAVLRAELTRLQRSPIVLNRRLREVTRARMQREGLSLSAIATRCGRVKHDAAGNESGETSWLARRLGMLPEGGRSEPTPWIHTDVLALIARHGLGLSPREVEVE